MNLAAPSHVVTSSLDGPVLAALARSARPASGREVHRLCGAGSPAGVHKVLRRLVSQGIVLADARAGITLYSLNRRHLAAEAIEAIARIPERLIDAIRAAIGSWERAPEHASLYGSFVRGTGDELSDVDLLLVRPESSGGVWEQRVVELQETVSNLTGNGLSVLEWTIAELLANRNTPLARSIEAEHLHLAGRPLSMLLRGER
ncbi:MAG: nucleotidyltransferase domain-containing protein [Actinobacteria bacterium]|nr:nucleotidyltransferase domain-containing protein [Actinomycetota bacterium]